MQVHRYTLLCNCNSPHLTEATKEHRGMAGKMDSIKLGNACGKFKVLDYAVRA